MCRINETREEKIIIKFTAIADWVTHFALHIYTQRIGRQLAFCVTTFTHTHTATVAATVCKTNKRTNKNTKQRSKTKLRWTFFLNCTRTAVSSYGIDYQKNCLKHVFSLSLGVVFGHLVLLRCARLGKIVLQLFTDWFFKMLHPINHSWLL